MATQNGGSKFTEKDDESIHVDHHDFEKDADADAPADGAITSNSSETEILDGLEKFQDLPAILQEGILLMGGAVAILLQAAASGMAQTATSADGLGGSQNLAERLFEGLRTTVIYMYGLTYGTRAERQQILHQINHRTPNKPEEYYPEDPQLRLWIAATLYATATDFYQRVFEKVDYHRAQCVYREFSVLTVALNLPVGSWPPDRNSFWVYWDDTVETLDVDSGARPVPHDLRAYQNVPGWVKLVRPFIQTVTPEMLPPHIREQYGFRSTSSSRFLYRLYIFGAKAVYPTLPARIRTIPKRRAMKQLQERTKP